MQESLFKVSIHAPRVGRDWGSPLMIASSIGFQFTHPVWGATLYTGIERLNPKVSIHAPRVGRDVLERLKEGSTGWFQFTHPVWGATRQQANNN